MANFTQSGYVALSVMTALAVTLMADEPGFAETLLTGFARWRHCLHRHWPDRYRGGIHRDGELARALPECGICLT